MSSCEFCKVSIVQHYHRVSSLMICPHCAEQYLKQDALNKNRNLFRGLLFASAAAVAGCLLVWLADELGRFTGSSIFSLGAFIRGGGITLAGGLVGAAAIDGARKRGSRWLQVGAGVLAYLAITMAAVPFMLVHLPSSVKVTPALLAALIVFAPKLPFFAVANSPAAITGLIVTAIAIWLAVSATEHSTQVDGPFELVASRTGEQMREERPLFGSYEV